MSSCVICTRDHKGSYACPSCVDTLARDLLTLAWLAAELIVTRTRQARLAGSNGRARGGAPLGYHVEAARAYDSLHNCLGGWVRDMADEDWPRDHPASMARWIARQRLAFHPAVDALRADVDRHTAEALAVINPEPDEQTYGVCGAEIGEESCTAYLYGEPGAGWVRCKRCLTQHDTRVRKQILEARMRVLFFRASTLARLLPLVCERPVSENNIRNWADKVRTGKDDAGFTTYNCGDVIEVALVTPKRDRKAKVAS